MDERTILRRAKEILLERGWHQGPMACASRPCIGFAVLEGAGVYNVWEVDYPLLTHLSVLVGTQYDPGSGALGLWNDHPSRTFTEVIDLLDSALASLEPSKTPELVA